MKHINKWLIPAGIGSFIIAAYAWQAPHELYLGIPSGVTVACTVFQTLDKK
jgi:hypothetical protein